MKRILRTTFNPDYNATFHLADDNKVYCQMTDGFFYDRTSFETKTNQLTELNRNKLLNLFDEAGRYLRAIK